VRFSVSMNRVRYGSAMSIVMNVMCHKIVAPCMEFLGPYQEY